MLFEVGMASQVWKVSPSARTIRSLERPDYDDVGSSEPYRVLKTPQCTLRLEELDKLEMTSPLIYLIPFSDPCLFEH